MPHLPNNILEIFKQESGLKMGLFDSDQSIPTLRHYSQLAVSFPEIRQLSLEIVGILNCLPADPLAQLEQLKSLQKTGRLLWDQLFCRSIKEKLKESPVTTLVLSLDEELISIPWELIYDGVDFLGLKFSLGRLVRSRGESTILRYRDLAEQLKMLILANPNDDLKSAYTEGINIRNQFNHIAKKVAVDFKSTNIDKNYVKKNINDYDIVHYAGHCEFNRKEDKSSGWVLSDGVLKIEEILKMGQSSHLPALIFSNACHSAQENPAFIDTEYQQAGYGMAGAFLSAGVRHYIGAIRRIEDNASLIFAKEFYAKLILGISVGEALRQARLKLIKEYGLSSLHWVNYLLYGDPGFVLLKVHRHKQIKFKSTLYKKIIKRVSLGLGVVFLGVILAIWLPKINPGKSYLYLNSLVQYRQGNNQQVIALGEKILKQDRDFLKIYPIVAAAYQSLGQKDKALKYYYDYMLISERLNDLVNLVQAYVQLGWFYQLSGDYPRSQELYHKAIDLSRKLKNRQAEALALRKLAVWHIDKNNYDQALDLLTKSVAINLEKPDNAQYQKNLASDYFDIGLVFVNKNDYPAAKEFYEKSLRIFKRLKLDNELSDCYYNLGEVHFYEKEYQKALDYYFKGLKVDKKYNNKINLASGYNIIGELCLEIDDLVKAEDYFKQALSLSAEIQSQPDLANASYNLGVLYKKQGRKNLARQYWRQAQEIYYQIDPEKYRQVKAQLLDLDTIH